MHGAGDGNIIFGDGLENYPDKEITPKSFDILVANPPYSVKAFKPHLKLSNNQLDILEKISNDGSEIETLFVERISQLLKPNGVAAVVLPSSILNKENESFISARESLLKNFNIIAIATLASGIVDYVAEYIFDETLLLISEDGANLVSRNMPIAFSITGKSWVNNHVHILRFKNYKLQKYVESYINNIDLSEYINKNANPKLTQEKLNSIMIYMPNDTTLDLYISSIDQCDKLKFEAQERLEELNAAREDIIDKYFR